MKTGPSSKGAAVNIRRKRTSHVVTVVAAVGLIATACGSPGPNPAPPQHVWTQFVADGVRVVALVDGGCPAATVDGSQIPMVQARSATSAFPLTTCTARIPEGATSVSVAGTPAPPPPKRLNRIVVVGDVGCYLKKQTFQDCHDPAAFPAKQLGQQITKERADLVVYVGDMYLSQTECPDSQAVKCGGVPVGDKWATWAYDFFDPYQPALASAPWIIARGNHEACTGQYDNGGPGWFQIFAPEAGVCSDRTDPYVVMVAGQSFVVFDSAAAEDTPVDESQVPAYSRQFRKVHELTSTHPGSWLVTHRPLWAAGAGEGGGTFIDNLTLQAASAAAGNTIVHDVDLVLSGHIHALGRYTFADGRAPQVVSGGGGARLSPAGDFRGAAIDGTTFTMATLVEKFGYVVMDRDEQAGSWTVRYVDVGGENLVTCTFATRELTCP